MPDAAIMLWASAEEIQHYPAVLSGRAGEGPLPLMRTAPCVRTNCARRDLAGSIEKLTFVSAAVCIPSAGKAHSAWPLSSANSANCHYS